MASVSSSASSRCRSRADSFRAVATSVIPLGTVSITWSVVIALAVVAVAVWVLARTRFGRTTHAIGGNEQSAVLMGLPVARVKVGVYAVSGLCSAIAGLLFALYMLSGYGLHAVGMELDAIAAVVIGGTLLSGGVGYVLGSLLGVLVLGVIQTLISFQGTLSSWWTKIAIGTLLLIFIVMQRVFVRRQSRATRSGAGDDRCGRLAGVSHQTVSRVINGAASIRPATVTVCSTRSRSSATGPTPPPVPS